MSTIANSDTAYTFTDFERITRGLRWFAIAAVLMTFPDDQARILIIYALALAAIAFNLSRYSATFLRWRVYASPITILIIDSIFIGLLIALVGDINTPYSAFLVFLIITAVYKFGLPGMLAVAGVQIGWLFVLMWQPLFPPLALTGYQSIIISAFALLALGTLVERLTHSDRQQRGKLEKLNRENMSERSHLLALLNSIQDAVYMVDARGRLVEHNEMAVSLMGHTGDLRGKDFKEVLPLHTRVNISAKPIDILKDSAASQHRRDLAVQTEHGAVYDLDVQVTPILLSGEKSTGYIVVCRDITKERTLDEQRKEFISVTSHELRTPISIMEAALSSILMVKDTLPNQTVALLETAHRNSLYLGGIVKDLGLLSEAQNDNLPIELTEIDPQPLLVQLVKDFQAQAKQQGLSIAATTIKGTPHVLSTERHLKEVLQNYVNNALKYTKQGGIKIKAEPSQGGGVTFSVIDTGIGISHGDQKRLFTKFFRAEDYRTRETGGTGLGLYLCQELAGRLNAKVWAESTLNQGSIFYLEVPPFSQLQRDRGEVVKAQVSTLVNEL